MGDPAHFGHAQSAFVCGFADFSEAPGSTALGAPAFPLNYHPRGLLPLVPAAALPCVANFLAEIRFGDQTSTTFGCYGLQAPERLEASLR